MYYSKGGKEGWMKDTNGGNWGRIKDINEEKINNKNNKKWGN